MWKWTDGSDFNYTNWRVGEPNDFEASGEYYIDVNNRIWNDVVGDQKLPYVCKCTEY